MTNKLALGQWHEGSLQGKLCASYGCMELPDRKCVICGAHLCRIHWKIHKHLDIKVK